MDVIKPYIDLVDMVTLMAVEPGFSGQKFMIRTIDRVEELASLRKHSENDFLINVDGAINDAGLVPCVRRGSKCHCNRCVYSICCRKMELFLPVIVLMKHAKKE